MNNQPIFDELLDSLVKKEISFEELLLQSGNDNYEEVYEQAQLHTLAAETIKNYAIWMQVSDVHKEFLAENKFGAKETKVVKMEPQKWMMRVAASVALLIGLYFTQENLRVNPDRMYKSTFQEYYINTERSIGIIQQNELVESFRKGNYAQVAKQYGLTAGNSVQETFLSGYSNLVTGNYSEAEELFRKIIADNHKKGTAIYLDEAEFYLALTQLKQDKVKDAYQLMNQIYSNKEHTYNDAVSRWMLFRMKWF